MGSHEAFDSSDESKHVAELLEIAGAQDISPAVRLQVAAMRSGDSARLGKIFAKAQEQEKVEASKKKQNGQAVNFKTLTAVGKFKNNLNKV